MIASKTLYKILFCLIAFVSLVFVSCSLWDTDTDTDTDVDMNVNVNVGTTEETGGFAILKISCDGSLGAARTVMPNTPQSLNDMSGFVLEGNRQGELKETIKTWTSYSQLANDSLIMLPGPWEFFLTADYNGISYTDEVTETLVKDTSTTINFTLKSSATGTGSISVTIKWPDSSQAQKVTATLCNSIGSAVGGEADLAISGTSATYTNSAVAAGNYLVKFNFYRDAAGTDKINTYVCAVQVVAGFDSSGTETIELLNNKYTLTLDANGGTFGAGVPTTRTFTEYEYVDLPTYSDISLTGYAFKGWYEDAAGTGTEVKSWDVGGMKRDLNLFAKWEICTEIYLDGAGGNDSNDGATATTVVATLAKALENLNLAAPNPRIIVVSPYTLASGEKLEIAAGNELTVVRDSGCTGSLITVPAGGTLSLSGAAQIFGDVYLASGATITVAGALAPSDATKPVAVITPESYTETPTVLTASTAELIADNIEKFALPGAATNYAIAQDDTATTNAVIVDNTPRETVYLDAAGGSDVKDGSTKALAVKTLTRATKLLKDAAGAKIIIVKPYTLASTETGLLDFSTTRTNAPTLERYYSSTENCSGDLLTISSGTVVIKNVTFDGNWKKNGSEQLANANGSLLRVTGTTVTLGAGCTIKNNSISGNGGGIYNSGTFTMDGGEISGNTARYGGGIYNNRTVTMSGGTISGNTNATNGNGIYNNATLNFSGAAAVNANNDVYLPANKFITVTGNLTGAAPIATIKPETYADNTVVLKADRADLITANYSKFTLSSTGTYNICPDSATPTQAILAKPQVSSFITIAGDFSYRFTLKNGTKVIDIGSTLDVSQPLSFTVEVSYKGGTFMPCTGSAYKIGLWEHVNDPKTTAGLVEGSDSVTIPAFLQCLVAKSFIKFIWQ